MKPTLHISFLLAFLFFAGCDQNLPVPAGSGNTDFLDWMKTMTKVKVTYSGSTLLHSYHKDGTLDPGHSSDLWLPREMEFSNWDSTYTISWQDSQFQTKSCSVFREIDPSYTLSSDCGNESFILGVYHSGSQSISDLACKLYSYHGGSDPNNYLEQGATLIVPYMELDSFRDDSLVFTVKNWKAGSLSIGYNYDEVAYSTYHKQMELTAYDTAGTTSSNICRIVFLSK